MPGYILSLTFTSHECKGTWTSCKLSLQIHAVFISEHLLFSSAYQLRQFQSLVIYVGNEVFMASLRLAI